jgi:serine/threonine protein kinase
MPSLVKAGRYQIVAELGRGNMGVVYKAFDPVIGRTVAVKTMLTEGLSPEDYTEYRQRFQREAQAAGILAHPNIVTVYDFGDDQGVLYLTMEYLEGVSLQQLLQQQRMPSADRIIALFEQVCSALDHAHSHGIVHRDVKPANIMVLANGVAKVTDFGVAKMLTAGMTQSGHALGSPSYMSPEQVKGEELDGRSDIFSLGVILYEVLTGQRPFDGKNITTVIYKIISEEPVSPREINPAIHPGLCYVTGKALAKDRNQRYQTCRELAADLRNYQNLGEAASTVRVPSPLPAEPELGDLPTQAIDLERVPLETAVQSAPPQPDDATRILSPAPEPRAGTTGVLPPPPQQGEEVARVRPAAPEARRPAWLVGLLALLVVGVAGGGGAYYYWHRPASPPAARQAVAPPSSGTSLPPAPTSGSPSVTPAPTSGSPSVTPPPALAEQSSAAGSRRGARPRAEPASLSTPSASGGRKAEARWVNPQGEATRSVKPPVASPPADATPGTLEVSANVRGAQVFLNGRTEPGWTAPHTFPALPPGEYVVTVSKPGYQDWVSRATIGSGQKASLAASLKAPFGYVTIETNPPGVEVMIDDQPRGKSPLRDIQLPVGKHTYSVNWQGWGKMTRTFEVRPDAAVTMTANQPTLPPHH